MVKWLSRVIVHIIWDRLVDWLHRSELTVLFTIGSNSINKGNLISFEINKGMKMNMRSLVEKYKNIRSDSLIRNFSTQFAYGHREILLDYAGLDQSLLLTGILQHGVGPAFTLYSDWPTPRVKFIIRTPLWVYSNVAARELASVGAKRVQAIGSPWLYAKQLELIAVPQNLPKTSYLVFARHFSDALLDDISPEGIRAKIRFWKSISGSEELVICLYYIEFTNYVWQTIARQEGVVLKCAGVGATSPAWSQSRSRIDYYKNLSEIISLSTHCIFESFSSAMFYANDLGKHVGIFKTDTESRVVNEHPLFQKEFVWLLKNLPGIFNTCENSTTLNEITHEQLGYDDILSPQELSHTLSYQTGIVPRHLS